MIIIETLEFFGVYAIQVYIQIFTKNISIYIKLYYQKR
jgi:hypothetical protein